jgi:hypothetical protein
LRSFLSATRLPHGLVEKQKWDGPEEYKVVIVRKILDDLTDLGDEGSGPLGRLTKAVLDIQNFDHLRGLEDGAAKVQAARQSVEREMLRVRVDAVAEAHNLAIGTEPPDVRLVELIHRLARGLHGEVGIDESMPCGMMASRGATASQRAVVVDPE